MTPPTSSSVRLVWPAPSSGATFPRMYDANTGRDYSMETLTLTVHVDAKANMWVDALMITDANDQIAAPGAPVLLNDNQDGYRRGSFRFSVAEMAVE